MGGLSAVADPEGRQETPEENQRSLGNAAGMTGKGMDTVSAPDLKESRFLETLLSEGRSSGVGGPRRCPESLAQAARAFCWGSRAATGSEVVGDAQ